MTYLKVTGGKLSVKQLIEYSIHNRQDSIKKEEKVNQIYIYSGEKYSTVNEVCAGTICAVSGLTSTYAGQG